MVDFEEVFNLDLENREQGIRATSSPGGNQKVEAVSVEESGTTDKIQFPSEHQKVEQAWPVIRVTLGEENSSLVSQNRGPALPVTSKPNGRQKVEVV